MPTPTRQIEVVECRCGAPASFLGESLTTPCELATWTAMMVERGLLEGWAGLRGRAVRGLWFDLSGVIAECPAAIEVLRGARLAWEDRKGRRRSAVESDGSKLAGVGGCRHRDDGLKCIVCR